MNAKACLSGASVMLKLIYCVALIPGCGARYTIYDETFGSSSEALQKQSEINSHSLDMVTPTDNSVHGNALVLIPSNVEIQKDYIRFSYNASELDNEQIEYLITATANNWQFMANAIRKRAIFDSVSVARHNGNPVSFPIGEYDFVVFLDVDGWSIKGKDNPRALHISFDISNSEISDIDSRRLAFLDLLSQRARIIHGK
jgi:hypothetical protein